MGFFEPWWRNENSHGDIVNLRVRCWSELRRGLRGQLLRRFFLASLVLTPSLTVWRRCGFYRRLGLDRAAFDAEVMRPSNDSARRALPWVFALESGSYLALRDRLIATFRAMRTAHS